MSIASRRRIRRCNSSCRSLPAAASAADFPAPVAPHRSRRAVDTSAQPERMFELR